MDQESHIAYRQVGDFTDFLVTEIALELEIDDFALILRQGFYDLEYLADGSALVKVGRDRDFRVP